MRFVTTVRDLAIVSWPVPLSALRPLLPRPLEPVLADGNAWVSLAALRQERYRCAALPWPRLSFVQCNLRTYVSLPGGESSGAFFFVSAVSSLPAMLGGRAMGLPYDWDRLHLSCDGTRYSLNGLRNLVVDLDLSVAPTVPAAVAALVANPMLGYARGAFGRPRVFDVAHETLRPCPAAVRSAGAPGWEASGFPRLDGAPFALYAPSCDFAIRLPPRAPRG